MQEKIHDLRTSGENSVFRKTLKKGIASSLIPLLLMGVCIFAIDTNRSQEQLGEITLSMMEKNDQIVQYLLEDVERGARNLTLSSSVVDFSVRPWALDVERNTNICGALNNFSRAYDFVDGGFLFSPVENMRIASSGLITYGGHEDCFALFEEATVSAVPLRCQTAGKQLLLATKIPADSQSPLALLVFRIDLERFLAAAINSGRESTAHNTYVIDAEGGLLFSQIGLETAEPPESAANSQGNESFLFFHDSQLLRCAVYRDEALGWTYLDVAGALTEDSGWTPMLLPLLLSVLGACIVGLLLVYQNSRSLYDPLKQLIAAVGGPSEMDLPQDEYRWLAGHYDKLLEQREEVYEQVAAIRPLLQKKFLLSLLNGESSPDEIMHQMSVLELPFQMAMFGTFLLQIDDYYSLPYSEEEKQEFRAQIQAQITAYANEQVSCITAEVNDETILCVCNLQAEEKEETAKQIFRSYLQEIRDGIGELWPFTLTIGIGGVCCSPVELPASCQKARTALSYKIYRGKGCMIDADDLPNEPRQAYHGTEKASLLINSVRAGDERLAVRLVHEIFQDVQSQQLSPKQVQSLMQYVASGVGEVIRTAELGGKDGVPADPEKELTQRRTLAEMEDWLEAICRGTAAAVKAGSSERMRHNAEQIKTYIDRNLMKNISLASISEHVNYSPTYVSKVFRQHYGTSYIDYLNSSRVKLSQELLLSQPELSVKEVGFKVGFNNLQSFFRVFKKHTGMTPLQYRERQRDQGPEET